MERSALKSFKVPLTQLSEVRFQVRRHLHHPLPQQEGPVREEDPPQPAEHLLPGIQRSGNPLESTVGPLKINLRCICPIKGHLC